MLGLESYNFPFFSVLLSAQGSRPHDDEKAQRENNSLYQMMYQGSLEIL